MSLTQESVAVVTGAGSGIGRALCLQLAAEKIAGLAIADLNREALEETARMLEPSGARVSTHVLSVADYEAMQAFVADVLAEHGRVTHLINNAGVSLFGDVEEVSIEDFEWLMSINFWGTVYGVKLFLPVLRQQPAAHIINVSSVFGLIAPPGNAAYSASKFAVRGFTEALRHELQDTGVAVSCVHPGGVATNIARSGRLASGAHMAAKEESVKYHTKVSKTTSEEAASQIIRGIKRRSKRILVGRDARLIDVIHRASPENYLSVMDRISHGHLSRLRRKRKASSA
ncbi:MAG TPA: SDR family NAD(P)-dependent oxidoreductase [Pyrinomonadaceae bacterium]|jgi:NAD(P)-dependent dehydrogenase (short-subunit alcohol dehydrogenase family)